jgi:ATP-binding cassette subfamily C protein
MLRLIPPARVAASGALVAALTGVEGLAVLLLIPLVQLAGIGAGAAAPASQVTDVMRAVGLPVSLGSLLVVYVLVAAVQGALRRAEVELTSRIEQDVVIGLRQRLSTAIWRLRWDVFARLRSTDLAHLLTAGVDRVGIAVHHALDLLIGAAVVAVYVAIAVSLSPLATLVTALAGAALALVLRARMAGARASGARVSDAMMRLHGAVSEQLWSMKTARSFGAEERHAAELERLAQERRDVAMASARELGRFQQQLAFGSVVALAALVYVSAQILAVPTVELLVLLFIVARVMPRMTGLYERVQYLTTLSPAFEEVRQATEDCEAAAEPAPPEPRPIAFEREVRFDRVTCRYDERAGAPALCDVDLRFLAGTTTAIAGTSGAGKTTIADLLLGLLTPAEGEIRIDGVRLDPSTLSSWRSQVAYVPQDTFLFHDTVRANLLWAKPDAGEADLWQALALADADDLVASWPDGLDTMLGDRGVLVSGGERQRLALARALLRRPALLVLDEATSALDPDSEARVLSAIDGLHGRTTIVVITHRPGVLRFADAVCVLERGRVIESGPPGPRLVLNDGPGRARRAGSLNPAT